MAAKAVGPLATGALSGLANVGVNKIFGKGQVGGFLIPQNKIDQLIKYKDWLTEAQKKQIVNAIHTGGQIVIKPTKAQPLKQLRVCVVSVPEARKEKGVLQLTAKRKQIHKL